MLVSIDWQWLDLGNKCCWGSSWSQHPPMNLFATCAFTVSYAWHHIASCLCDLVWKFSTLSMYIWHGSWLVQYAWLVHHCMCMSFGDICKPYVHFLFLLLYTYSVHCVVSDLDNELLLEPIIPLLPSTPPAPSPLLIWWCHTYVKASVSTLLKV